MTLPIKTVATNLITDTRRGETQGVAYWSDVEKVVRYTGEIAAAVMMSRINTLRCHGRNKTALAMAVEEMCCDLGRLAK